LVDEIANIHRAVLAHHDVFPTWTQCVAWFDDDTPRIARIADDIETADDSMTMQMSIVEFILLDNVMFQPVEIILGQQLPGKKARPAETIDIAARRTRRRTFLRRILRPLLSR
jgi:hypothetical protein